MEETAPSAKGNPIVSFFASPFRVGYPAPMHQIGDWFSAAGIVMFIISVFALPWLTVGVKDVFGIESTLGIKPPRTDYGLFVSPWAWGMVAILIIMLAGLWFVQTRGGILLGAGIYCLLFNVIFYIGAWQKINAIIGDVVSLARNIPFIGNTIGEVIRQLAKSMLDVHVAAGFWLFIPAGVLLVVGGSLRLAAKSKEVPVP